MPRLLRCFLVCLLLVTLGHGVGAQTLPAIPAPVGDDADGPYPGYYPWPALKTKIAGWARDYPNLVTVGILGKTYEGRDIPLLRLSAKPLKDPAPEVLLMGGIHPREQQPQVCMVQFLDELLAGYGKDSRLTALLNNRQIWVIPILNVDGKVWDMQHGNGQTKGADWRKNRHPNPDGTVGTDLNRNFAVRWGGSRMIDPDWRTTTTDTKGNIYEGPGPLSEPESRALAAFIADRKNLRAFMDIHSPLRVINFPPYTVKAESDRFLRIAEGMQHLQTDRPYPLQASYPGGEPPALPRGGNSGLTYTWAYYTQGVYGFNFEIGLPVRYPAPADIHAEYKKNVRAPWLFFLEAAGDLPAATPGTLACETARATLSGKLVPGATVTWTPPAPTGGACDWATLVTGSPQVVVPSEYRRMPLEHGFTLQVPLETPHGAVVHLTLYLWDKDRHVSPVSVTLTVE